tara:strand:+ start:792 stop:1067 length:276 start_codon:yes stop_codon:yes gene_type:complete
VFGFWWWVDLFVDFIFLLDILLNFRVGIVEKVGTHAIGFEQDWKKVACEYCKLWFWVDFITSVPLVPVIEAIAYVRLRSLQRRNEEGRANA